MVKERTINVMTKILKNLWGDQSKIHADNIHFESGSNDDGEWLQFPSGLQICLHESSAGSVHQAIGSVYRTSNNSWTFPKPFIEKPYVDHTAENSSRWGNARGNSGTNASYWQYQGQNSGASVPGKLIAIGR